LPSHQEEIEKLAALALAPLVEIAWADGHVTDGERQGVLEAAKALGLGQYTEFCRSTLRRWLTEAPPTEALSEWRRALASTLAESEGRTARTNERGLLEQALRVARMDERSFLDAGDGIKLDPQRGVVPEERRILEELQAALASIRHED